MRSRRALRQDIGQDFRDSSAHVAPCLLLQRCDSRFGLGRFSLGARVQILRFLGVCLFDNLGDLLTCRLNALLGLTPCFGDACLRFGLG